MKSSFLVGILGFKGKYFWNIALAITILMIFVINVMLKFLLRSSYMRFMILD